MRAPLIDGVSASSSRRRRLPTTVARRRRRGARQDEDALIAACRLDFDPKDTSLDAAFAPNRWHGFRLEIGFGKGEYLLAQAERNPQIGFIGVELYRDGLLAAARRLETRRLEARRRGAQGDAEGGEGSGGTEGVRLANVRLANVRLHEGDARDLLDALPPACLLRIDVLYPDPWRKARHLKRRLIDDETLAATARVLSVGGALAIATDSDDYADAIAARLEASVDFVAEAGRDRRMPPDRDWTPTRYERKAVDAGRVPSYFLYRRR